MSLAHLHLALNHFPVVGVIGGFLVLSLGGLRRSSPLVRASLWFFVVSALVAIPVYFTGEPAEHLLEAVGVAEDVMEPHEEFALFAFVGTLLLGVVSAFGLWYFREPYGDPPRWLVGGTWLVAAVATGLIAWTALLGGRIRHPEVRPGFQAPAGEADEGEEVGGAAEAALRLRPAPPRGSGGAGGPRRPSP